MRQAKLKHPTLARPYWLDTGRLSERLRVKQIIEREIRNTESNGVFGPNRYYDEGYKVALRNILELIEENNG